MFNMLNLPKAFPSSSMLALLVTVLLHVSITAAASSPAMCTVCMNGQDDLYVNRSKALTVQGLVVSTCDETYMSASLFTVDSPICNSIRTLGSFCGCPVADYSCTLCSDGSLPTRAVKKLPSIDPSEYVPDSPEGFILDCLTFASSLNYLFNKTDDNCLLSQQKHEEECGCPVKEIPAINITQLVANITNTTRNANKTSTHVTKKPTNSSSFNKTSTKQRRVSCTVCLDGTTSKDPNRSITMGSLPIKNCRDLDSFAALVRPNSTECGNAQALGFYCGCHVPNPFCSLCPNGEPAPYQDKIVYPLRGLKGLPSAFISQATKNLTCGAYESVLALPSPEGFGVNPNVACLGAQFWSGSSCGCEEGYKAKLVFWMFHISSALSLFGCFFTLRHIWNKSPEERTTYHHVILGMTCFDIISCIAYLMSGFFLPVGYGYLSHGNHGTCVLQGFLIQLGLTSLFYNAGLSIYYLLLVKYNWNEEQFRVYRTYIYWPILIIGMVLAGFSTKFIAPNLGYCYVATPPFAENKIAISMFFALPMCLALFTTLTCSITMWHHMSFVIKPKLLSGQQEQENYGLTKLVCSQAGHYNAVFITISINLFCANYGSKHLMFAPFMYMGLPIAAFFAPSQGFFNCLIYFQRAALLRRICCCSKSSSSKEPADNSAVSSSSAGGGDGDSEAPMKAMHSATLTESESDDCEVSSSLPIPPMDRPEQWSDGDKNNSNDSQFTAAVDHWKNF